MRTHPSSYTTVGTYEDQKAFLNAKKAIGKGRIRMRYEEREGVRYIKVQCRYYDRAKQLINMDMKEKLEVILEDLEAAKEEFVSRLITGDQSNLTDEQITGVSVADWAMDKTIMKLNLILKGL